MQLIYIHMLHCVTEKINTEIKEEGSEWRWKFNLVRQDLIKDLATWMWSWEVTKAWQSLIHVIYEGMNVFVLLAETWS